jgi:hypothetical protein
VIGSPSIPLPHAGPEGDQDPIERVVTDIVARLRLIMEAPDAKLNCTGLIELIGVRAYPLTILIFCLLNLLPGPPGYSIIIGAAIMAFSLMMILERPMGLWGFVGDRNVPLKLLLRVLETLARFTSLIARVSSPRYPALTGRLAIPLIGVFGILMGIGMLNPVPFTNTLPSIGMAVVCVGMLNHDGIACLTGVIIGIIGLILFVVSIWLTINLGIYIGDAIID